VSVKICKALDEAPADLAEVFQKSIRSDQDIVGDRVHFRENCPRPGLHLERIQQRDNVLRSGLKVIKNFEDLKLVRFLANFLRDELLVRVGPSKHR
jgi:hypothetical protein